MPGSMTVDVIYVVRTSFAAAVASANFFIRLVVIDGLVLLGMGLDSGKLVIIILSIVVAN